jgi:hypothetical protein
MQGARYSVAVSEQQLSSRPARVLTTLVLTAAVSLAGVASFRATDRSLPSGNYRAIAFGEIEDMAPSQHASKWLRDTAGRRVSMYRAIGAIDGRTLLVHGDVVPDPQLLFGIGRVDRLERIDVRPERSFATPAECPQHLAGVDAALGKYELCLSSADEVVMFRDAGLLVIQDAS